jgi:antitoxin component of MazEF toxin-antitoxin module
MEVEKRKLIKFSNYSLCITLPKWVLRKLLWEKGEEVNVQVDEKNGKLIISKTNHREKEDSSSDLRW